MHSPFSSSGLRLIQSILLLDLFRWRLGRLSIAALFLALAPVRVSAGPEGEQPRAAVFSERLPGFDQVLAREISAQVQAAGYATEFIGTTILTNQALLTAKRYDLLVLPGARSLPMAAAPAIRSYLQEGGDLLALGLPAWQSPLFQIRGEWMSRESYEDVWSAANGRSISSRTLTMRTCRAGRARQARRAVRQSMNWPLRAAARRCT